MAGSTGTRPGSRIARIELHEFKYVVDNLGLDPSGNRVPMTGASSELRGFALVILTADGQRGEFVPAHSGKSGVIVSQVRALAG